MRRNVVVLQHVCRMLRCVDCCTALRV